MFVDTMEPGGSELLRLADYVERNSITFNMASFATCLVGHHYALTHDGQRPTEAQACHHEGVFRRVIGLADADANYLIYGWDVGTLCDRKANADRARAAAFKWARTRTKEFI